MTAFLRVALLIVLPCLGTLAGHGISQAVRSWNQPDPEPGEVAARIIASLEQDTSSWQMVSPGGVLHQGIDVKITPAFGGQGVSNSVTFWRSGEDVPGLTRADRRHLVKAVEAFRKRDTDERLAAILARRTESKPPLVVVKPVSSSLYYDCLDKDKDAGKKPAK